MNDLAIEVEGLCKEYQLDRLQEVKMGAILTKEQPTKGNNTFMALKDITFKVKKGEVYGIIGANGAGKSTLLKILSGVTSPTKGYAKVTGNVTSLLEVGTGFHPELTGRENIFMNGAILGMAKHEITEKLEEIIAFSEVENFIDIPVKRYSSGMLVRLAFSVAIHLKTDILIIDEVLSVGDAAFQAKSIKAIKNLIHNNCTVIIVSHNIESVKNLCEKVVVLHEGKVVSQGKTEEQIVNYLSTIQKKGEKTHSYRNWTIGKAPGNDTLKLTSVGVRAASKNYTDKIFNSDDIELSVEFYIQEKVKCIDVAFRVSDLSGFLILATMSNRNLDEDMVGKQTVICTIPSQILNQGKFLVDVRFLKQKKEGKFFYADKVVGFTIDKEDGNEPFETNLPGVLKLDYKWKLSSNESEESDE